MVKAGEIVVQLEDWTARYVRPLDTDAQYQLSFIADKIEFSCVWSKDRALLQMILAHTPCCGGRITKTFDSGTGVYCDRCVLDLPWEAASVLFYSLEEQHVELRQKALTAICGVSSPPLSVALRAYDLDLLAQTTVQRLSSGEIELED